MTDATEPLVEGGDDRRATERTCAVSRVAKPVEGLIRFVRAPDGAVVPDLRRRLPGRGVWVTAERAVVADAVKRRAFARSFKQPVLVDTALPETVESLLERAAVDMLSMANKAGRVVSGFGKVETAIARGDVLAVLHAGDGADDGKRKLGQALRRAAAERTVRVLETFTSSQMSLALGRENVVHAALLSGPVSDAFVARALELARYRGQAGAPADRRNDEPGQPAETDVE